MVTLQETLRGLFETETDAARAVLSEGRDRNTAVKLAVRAAQRAEHTFLPVLQTVACKAGCASCCRGVRVDVTAPEALTIARGFRETLSAAHLAILREHVERHAAAVRAMTLEERYRARTPCALLDEASNRCSVYDARPMRCRAHHSLSATDCEAISIDPERPRVLPRYPGVMDGHDAMILGQRRALAAERLDFRSFELSLALSVALAEDDGAERWARGERLFDAAVFSWPDEPPAVESDLPRVLLGEHR